MSAAQGEDLSPVRKHVLVRAPQDRAFRVFTENLDSWYPREHHIGKSPLKTVVPRARGWRPLV